MGAGSHQRNEWNVCLGSPLRQIKPENEYTKSMCSYEDKLNGS